MSTLDSNSDPPQRENRCTGQEFREAELLLGNRDLKAAGMGDLVTSWRESGLREFKVLSNSETRAAIHVLLDQPLDGGRLSTHDSVERWARVRESRDTTTYIFECTSRAFPPSLATRSEDVIGPYDLQLTEHGISMSLLGPQGRIGEVIEKYKAAGFSPDIRKIGPYAGYSYPLDVLTERQREVLTLAFEMQYYEIPRNVSVKDIAAEIGIGSSTVAEHLQRAEAKLLARLLADQ